MKLYCENCGEAIRNQYYPPTSEAAQSCKNDEKESKTMKTENTQESETFSWMEAMVMFAHGVEIEEMVFDKWRKVQSDIETVTFKVGTFYRRKPKPLAPDVKAMEEDVVGDIQDLEIRLRKVERTLDSHRIYE